MKYRIRMLSPELDDPLPLTLSDLLKRSDSQQMIYTVIPYENPEELRVRLHNAVNSTIDLLYPPEGEA